MTAGLFNVHQLRGGRARNGDPVWFGRGQMPRPHGGHPISPTARSSAMRQLRSNRRNVIRWINPSRQRLIEAGLGQQTHRRRDGQATGSLARRLWPPCKQLPNAKFSDTTAAGELAACGQSRPRSFDFCARARGLLSACTRHLRQVAKPGYRSVISLPISRGWPALAMKSLGLGGRIIPAIVPLIRRVLTHPPAI